MRLLRKESIHLFFQGLKTTITSDESRMINFDTKPKVILSASGMCEAGRIRHHLKHNLWKKESTICFVGYQAVGTLGRKLIEGAECVKLFGETVEVNAKIESLKGISGHADRNGLLDWLSGFENTPQHVFVVHGEDQVTDTFAEAITEKFGWPAMAPYSEDVWILLQVKSCPLELKNRKRQWKNQHRSVSRMHFTEWSQRQRGCLMWYIRMKDLQTKN